MQLIGLRTLRAAMSKAEMAGITLARKRRTILPQLWTRFGETVTGFRGCHRCVEVMNERAQAELPGPIDA